MTPKKKEHVARHMLLLLRSSSFVLPQLLTLNRKNAAKQPRERFKLNPSLGAFSLITATQLVGGRAEGIM